MNDKRKILIRNLIKALQNKDAESVKELAEKLKYLNEGQVMIYYSEKQNLCQIDLKNGYLLLSLEETEKLKDKFERILWFELPDDRNVPFMIDHINKINEYPYKQLNYKETAN